MARTKPTIVYQLDSNNCLQSFKKCRHCNALQSTDNFHKHPKTSDHLSHICKKCNAVYTHNRLLRRALDKADPVVLARLHLAPIERLRKFAPKIQVMPSGCWEWTSNIHCTTGYGRFWFDKRKYDLAHRLAYQWSIGPIPSGLVIDHLCRNRKCVNPDHLEPVTNVENVMRGFSLRAINARKTHCMRGHLLQGLNLIVNKHGMRCCRTCKNATRRARRARKQLLNIRER